MQLSKEEKEAIEEIKSRSKGWPVGIYIKSAMAHNLVDKKLAEWAVPSYPTERSDILPVRLTTLGNIHPTDKWGDCDHESIVDDHCTRCGSECHSHSWWDSEEGKKRMKKLK